MSRRTLVPALPGLLRLRGFHPLWPAFPKPFCSVSRIRLCGPLPRRARAAVWALPVSLAATSGIDVSFFSSGYLDVSVRRVPLHALWIHAWMHGVRPVRVSPFRHLRIDGHVPLPAAFRSLSRLSSALSAKASALCPFLLDLVRRCIALQLFSCSGEAFCFSVSMLPFFHCLFLGCL